MFVDRYVLAEELIMGFSFFLGGIHRDLTVYDLPLMMVLLANEGTGWDVRGVARDH